MNYEEIAKIILEETNETISFLGYTELQPIIVAISDVEKTLLKEVGFTVYSVGDKKFHMIELLDIYVDEEEFDEIYVLDFIKHVRKSIANSIHDISRRSHFTPWKNMFSNVYTNRGEE